MKPIPSSGSLYVGSGYGAEYLDGNVDEVILYKRALNASELSWLYNSGGGRGYSGLTASPGTTNLVSWWALNETAGTRSDTHAANHLTDNNTVTSTTGKQGKAAKFVPANSEYLSIADNPSISMGSSARMTACTWVRLNSKNSNGVQNFVDK